MRLKRWPRQFYRFHFLQTSSYSVCQQENRCGHRGVIHHRKHTKDRKGTSSFQLATPAHRDFTGSRIDRMGQILADRHTRLRMNAGAEIETRKSFAKSLTAERIASINVSDMAAIGVERADRKLIAQQIELTRGEIEQRADRRICLAVIIAEMAFIVAFELGDPPVAQHLPVITELLQNARRARQF